MITRLAISGYRSLRDVVVGLGPLNVITGPNGSGKSSLYRALRLLSDIAQGRIIQSLAAEGGLASTLWAGPERIARSVRRGEHRVEGAVLPDSLPPRSGDQGRGALDGQDPDAPRPLSLVRAPMLSRKAVSPT